MKKKKYLNFYKKCMKTGYMPPKDSASSTRGLCGNLGDEAMSLFLPTDEDCNTYNVVSWGYWAYDKPGSYGGIKEISLSFGPTRQNMVLFLSAMNNEL